MIMNILIKVNNVCFHVIFSFFKCFLFTFCHLFVYFFSDDQDMFDADIGEEKLECEPVVYYDNDEDDWPSLMDDGDKNEFENSILVNKNSHNKVRRKKSIKGPKLHGKAIIHQLYEKHDDDRAKCKLCFKVFNTKRGNTTTMRRHAASKHPEEWSELQREAGQIEPNDLGLFTFFWSAICLHF